MSWLTKFELNPNSSLSANVQKLHDQSEARKWQNSAEYDPKLLVIRPGEYHEECIHQV